MFALNRRSRFLLERVVNTALSVPVRVKIAGIMALPVLILGFTLNYWVRTGLSDWLSYLLSDERVSIAMRAGSRSVLLITFLAAVGSILLSFLLIYLLTRPLLQLRQAAYNVAKGDFASRARVWGSDEIGDVAISVNSMIDQLVADREELKHKNARLDSINRLAMAASRELDLNKVLDATLEGMLDMLGLPCGWIYIRDLDEHRIRLAAVRGLPVDSPAYAVIADTDLGCACWNELISGGSPETVLIQKCSRGSGCIPLVDLADHITILIQARDQKFGLINLACPAGVEYSREDLDLLNSIGRQVSEIIANAWLHQRLVEKEAARQLLLHALVSAQDNERTRLARELHDEAGQSLTSLLIRLKTLEKKAGETEFRRDIDSLCVSVSKAIDQIREISYRFRPPALDEFGIEVALKSLLAEMTKDTPLETRARVELAGVQLPMEMQISLYRIAQEALTNVLRHARASCVTVELVGEERGITLKIADDGVGFDLRSLRAEDAPKRLGLLGIQERVEILAGLFTVHSAPGAGTTLSITIPVHG